MKQIVVALGLLLSFQLGAQTDSLSVKIDDLNPFERSELITIEERKKAIIEEYRKLITQIDREKYNKYAWIADKRGIDVTKIVNIKEEEKEIVFILKKE